LNITNEFVTKKIKRLILNALRAVSTSPGGTLISEMKKFVNRNPVIVNITVNVR